MCVGGGGGGEGRGDGVIPDPLNLLLHIARQGLKTAGHAH